MKGQLYAVFLSYYHQKLNIVPRSYESQMVQDFILMMLNHGKTKQFNLNIQSYRRLLEEHDRLSDQLREKETSVIKIPKNSRFILPDDTPIKNTWQTSSYSSRGYQRWGCHLIITGETFFTLVQNGTPKEDETIKLSLHSINEDGSLTPIHNVLQLTLESQDIKNLKMTGYSFFWPENTYHLQVTVTALDSDNHLLDQQVIYLDQRKVLMQEEAFRMAMYVKQALDNYLAPVTDSSANQIQQPTATTPEEVQSDHVEEIVETETPQYTLADLEYQLSKAKEELTATPEDETLK